MDNENERLARADQHPTWCCLSVRDVANRFGVDPKTVYRAPRRFGGKKVGGVWRFSVQGLERGAK